MFKNSEISNAMKACVEAGSPKDRGLARHAIWTLLVDVSIDYGKPWPVEEVVDAYVTIWAQGYLEKE